MAQGCELSFCFQHLGLNVAEYNNLIYHDTCADNVHQNIFTKKLKTRCGGGMESGCWVAAAAAADCYNTASLLHSWLQLLFNLSCHHNLGMRRNVRNANVEVVWCGDSEADSGGDSIRTRGSGATLHWPLYPAHLWPSSNVMDLVTLDPGPGHGEIMKIKFPMTIKWSEEVKRVCDEKT